ncbi:hypothetical protein EB796_019573 [Bugula neritina]|uniref:Uncharacterized protein n=1 Tax=Bugula neritina TaxID=10212 RepID=A0A7J7J7B8_BUGNE|nr:hypothetical protein EB796_019573 [Bugula neritina]
MFLKLTQPVFSCQVTKSSHIIIPTSVEVNRTIQSSLYYSPAMFTVKLTVYIKLHRSIWISQCVDTWTSFSRLKCFLTI